MWWRYLFDGGGILYCLIRVSPPENGQNHAQKSQSGCSGHSGDIFPIFKEDHPATNNSRTGIYIINVQV